jgi:hypothetical protein
MAQDDLSAELIADIYEAAIDDDRWPDIAQIVAKATGMRSAGAPIGRYIPARRAKSV